MGFLSVISEGCCEEREGDLFGVCFGLMTLAQSRPFEALVDPKIGFLGAEYSLREGVRTLFVNLNTLAIQTPKGQRLDSYVDNLVRRYHAS